MSPLGPIETIRGYSVIPFMLTLQLFNISPTERIVFQPTDALVYIANELFIVERTIILFHRFRESDLKHRNVSRPATIHS